MKATLREYGGHIDPLGRRAYVADSAAMTEATVEEFTKLVIEAQAQQPAAGDNGGARGGDVMTYTINIEHGGQPTALKQSDATSTDAFTALQNWLKRYGART